MVVVDVDFNKLSNQQQKLAIYNQIVKMSDESKAAHKTFLSAIKSKWRKLW